MYIIQIKVICKTFLRIVSANRSRRQCVGHQPHNTLWEQRKQMLYCWFNL